MKSEILALLALAATGLAQPCHQHHCQHRAMHEKRDIVTVTDILWVTETVGVTTTIWVDADSTATSTELAPPPPPSTTARAVLSSSTDSALVDEPIPTSSPASSSTSPVESSPSSSQLPPVPASSSSSSSSSSTTPAVLAAPSTAVPPPASSSTIDSSSPVYVAPTTIYTPTSAPSSIPTPVSTAVVSSSTSAPSTVGACSSGSPCTGDITYYDTGLGACGWTNDGTTSNVVALPYGLMGEQSNGNPYCGMTITVEHGGQRVQALVVDKCMGCEGDAIDLSRQAFGELADLSVGRTTATWWFE